MAGPAGAERAGEGAVAARRRRSTRVRRAIGTIVLVGSGAAGAWWMVDGVPAHGVLALPIAAAAVVGCALVVGTVDEGEVRLPAPGGTRRPGVVLVRRAADVRVWLTDAPPIDPRTAARGEPAFGLRVTSTAVPELAGVGVVDVVEVEGSTDVALCAPGGGPVLWAGRRVGGLPFAVDPEDLGLFDASVGAPPGAHGTPAGVGWVAGPGVAVRGRRDAVLVAALALGSLGIAVALGAVGAGLVATDGSDAVLLLGVWAPLVLTDLRGWIARRALTRDAGAAHVDPAIVGRPLTEQAASLLDGRIAAALPVIADRVVLLTAYWVVLVLLVPILA